MGLNPNGNFIILKFLTFPKTFITFENSKLVKVPVFQLYSIFINIDSCPIQLQIILGQMGQEYAGTYIQYISCRKST